MNAHSILLVPVDLPKDFGLMVARSCQAWRVEVIVI